VLSSEKEEEKKKKKKEGGEIITSLHPSTSFSLCSTKPITGWE
jgi:hypothetical protein